MKNPRLMLALAVLSLVLLVGVNFAANSTKNSGLVAVPARAGVVVGTSQNSDEFIWRLFAQFTAPVNNSQPSTVGFETWASDADTFSYTPHWPAVNEPKKLQASVLANMSGNHSPLDVPCAPPGNAAVGGFPTSGSPVPCIAEEVRRNRVQFDYIVNNNLNTQAGLAGAFARSFKVNMPTAAIAVKGDWVPVQTMVQWIPQLGSVSKIEKLYYTASADAVEYALVSLHVSSRQNPNWVWATFEHQLNPGRCDSMGCYDSFGAKAPVVLPNNAAVNSQYGACPKTQALKTIMEKARLARVWENYCLKSSQVDYTDTNGTPNVLGNSVTERIVGNGTIAASSCIACHVYASYGSTGATTAGAAAMLPYNPTGKPIPAVLTGSSQFDFMWGVLLAPKPPKN
jgi:hypothetical protein